MATKPPFIFSLVELQYEKISATNLEDLQEVVVRQDRGGKLGSRKGDGRGIEKEASRKGGKCWCWGIERHAEWFVETTITDDVNRSWRQVFEYVSCEDYKRKVQLEDLYSLMGSDNCGGVIMGNFKDILEGVGKERGNVRTEGSLEMFWEFV
ncbi:hypothetical protein LIER_19451 [Lithospermum erythrorhizon]|uniref:Uncharacterized protein n=1 Tax=Lithospermum erythrorhizon TaxID=34254 RepID=A0AAV3QKS8_LITER